MSAADLHRRIAALVGDAHVSAAPSHLRAYSRDAWPRGYLLAREGRGPRTPELVVWPGRVDEVAALVRLARDEKVPLIPYGAGSGVCGGVHALTGGITLDLKRLDAVGDVDPMDRLAVVGAGVVGQHLEDRLGRQGYTCGHFPSSMYCSTVGGWLAARGAGQMSSRYGKIEDLVAGLTFVDGTGEIHRLEATPRGGDGPDDLQLIIGSEGVLGVITEVTLRVFRAPEVRRMRGVLMPSVDAGIEAMRRIFAAGLRPAVCRLYDPLDTRVNKGKGTDPGDGEPGPVGALFAKVGGLARRTLPLTELKGAAARTALKQPGLLNWMVDRVGEASLMILGSEGTVDRLVEHEARRCLEICASVGGEDVGRAAGEHWLEHRYAVSYKLPPALAMGAFVDTMEVATTWDRLGGLYEAVRRAVRPHAFIMAHFSHAYEDGGSIYFTFSGTGDGASGREAAYDRTWSAALAAVDAAGATISHHHGVGLSKQALLPRELGGGLVALQALKSVLDPDGIMNPGKLALGEGPALPGAAFELGPTA